VGLPQVRELTPQRIAALRKREARNASFRQDWAGAVAVMVTHPHYRGENDRGWKADFDFMLQTKKDRVVEFLERGSGTGNRPPGIPANL